LFVSLFVFSGCLNYKTLSESDRNKNFLNQSVLKCDRSLPRAWYRFVGAAGKQMPTQCVPRYHCGTHAAGWLNGSHPTMAQGIVHRRVCFSWRAGCCQWSTVIRVQDCGAFFVYEFSGTPGCHFRYCGDGLGMMSTSLLLLFLHVAIYLLSALYCAQFSRKWSTMDCNHFTETC